MSTIYGNALILPSKDGGAKETWVLNERMSGHNVTYTIDFTSNGTRYSKLTISAFERSRLTYGDTLVYGKRGSQGSGWINQAYRKLTFDTPPTGDLLTWLQANAVKQPDDTAVQDTKALTITSNGIVSVTPDAPYDALKKVDVTVNVASGGSGGFNVSISIQRPFVGDTLVTCVMEEALPFKHAQGSLSMQAKMSEGGVVYTDDIATGSQAYEYIVNLLNVDVYFYTYTKGWVKQEITSFPYRFTGDVIAAIYIPIANNAIINTACYED